MPIETHVDILKKINQYFLDFLVAPKSVCLCRGFGWQAARGLLPHPHPISLPRRRVLAERVEVSPAVNFKAEKEIYLQRFPSMKLSREAAFVIIFFILFLSAIYARISAQTMKILVHMTSEQEAYLKTRVLPIFERQNNIKIRIEEYLSYSEIADKLKESNDSIGLVKVPFVKEWELVDNGYIRSLNSFLSPVEKEEFRKVYACWWLGARDNEQYYIPRKFETRILAYRPSKVAVAVDTWKSFTRAIDSSLEKINGRGLPKGYALESDPNEWDFFDLYVAGFVWAHTKFPDGIKSRIAQRGKLYDGTALTLIDRVFECGGDLNSLFNMNDKAVLDAFIWEAAYAWGGIYDSLMWTRQWTGQQLWDGFLNGSIYLTFFTQLDCITVLNKEIGRENINKDVAADFATAQMPRGCSIELDKAGQITRQGTHRVSTGGWWWGIPKRWNDPALAYKLARFITNHENQIKECAEFGMVPVRYDVIKDPNALFFGGPLSEVFKTSYKQIQTNDNFVLPSGGQIDTVTRCYLDAWKKIIMEKNWANNPRLAPTPDHIFRDLKENYAPRIMKMMQESK